MAEGVMEIRFVSKQEQFALPDVIHSVPTNIDEKCLNETVNQLLKETSDFTRPIEFDFIVLGELLRKPLGEHLSDKSVPTESTVDVEYVQRTPPPEPEDSILHDDWVYSLHTCAEKWILTGCYDNSVNIWTSHGKSIVSLKNHTDYVKNVKWVNKEDPSKGFLSASEDETIILWSWEEGSTNAKSLFTLKGHECGIEGMGVSPNSQKLATGGWDLNLKIWSTSLEKDLEEPAAKMGRNRGNVEVRTPIHTLEGHKQAIMSVDWLDNYTIITGSKDHTVRLWDAECMGLKNEIITNKAILCVSWSPLSNSLLTASCDARIRLYDPRSTEGAICKQSFVSHKPEMWVKSVQWSPYSEYLFVSGGCDSLVKTWDVRSPKAPLYDLQSHDGQVFTVDWSQKYIFSGGEDKYVHIYKAKA